MASGISSLHVHDIPTDVAEAGQIATIVLQNQETNNLVAVGEVLVSHSTPEILQMTIQFVFMSRIRSHLLKVGSTPIIYIGSARTEARISNIISKENTRNPSSVIYGSELQNGDAASIVIYPIMPIYAEVWTEENKSKFGRVLFIDNNEVIGVGKVTSIN